MTGCNIQFGFDYQGVSSEKSTEGKIDASVVAIEIKNTYGDVQVEATEGEADWSWNGSCWATEQADADAFLTQLAMDVSQSDSTQIWRISLPPRVRKLRGVKSNLSIRVPAETSVVIVNEHGTATAHGISGATRIDNEHGDVDASGLQGQATIKNQHGQILASGLSGTTKIDCEHGNVEVDGASDDVSIECEHGDIHAKNLHANVTTDAEHGSTNIAGLVSNVKCDAEHGDVKITLASSEFESVIADAQHASVEIVLPEATRPRLELKSEHGSVDSDIDSNDDDAAPRIKIKAEHGDIIIRAK